MRKKKKRISMDLGRISNLQKREKAIGRMIVGKRRRTKGFSHDLLPIHSLERRQVSSGKGKSKVVIFISRPRESGGDGRIGLLLREGRQTNEKKATGRLLPTLIRMKKKGKGKKLSPSPRRHDKKEEIYKENRISRTAVGKRSTRRAFEEEGGSCQKEKKKKLQ